MKAKWTGTTQLGETPGWAGDGTCEVLEIDEHKAGFGPGDVGNKDPGPAAYIQLNHKGHRCWVPVNEIEELDTESAS